MTDWMERAACLHADPEMFFPEKGEPADPARSICGGCGVRQACLDWALSLPETEGIWGGRTPKERRQLRRNRRAKGRAA